MKITGFFRNLLIFRKKNATRKKGEKSEKNTKFPKK